MYGLVLAAYGVGGALGALGVSSRRLPRRYLTVMLLMWGLGSLPLVVVGWTHSFPLMAAATFVVGVTDGAGMVIWGTLLQRRVPPADAGPGVEPGLLRVAGVHAGVDGHRRPAVEGGVDADDLPGRRRARRSLLAVIALFAARMPRDEIAHPLDAQPAR